MFGTLSDIYGRRATIITSMSLFIVGSILCAVAPNMTVLIIARGLQGLGGGGILPIVQTVIADVVTPRERGQYQAYFSGVWMAAGISGSWPPMARFISIWMMSMRLISLVPSKMRLTRESRYARQTG